MMINRFVVNAMKTTFLLVVTVLGACFSIYAGANPVLGSESCPFCSAASQTLRQEILSMDAVAIGRLETDGRIDVDGLAAFKIEKVLSGEKLIKVDQAIEASYFGPGKSAKNDVH